MAQYPKAKTFYNKNTVFVKLPKEHKVCKKSVGYIKGKRCLWMVVTVVDWIQRDPVFEARLLLTIGAI